MTDKKFCEGCIFLKDIPHSLWDEATQESCYLPD
jgi:hypothetical protein